MLLTVSREVRVGLSPTRGGSHPGTGAAYTPACGNAFGLKELGRVGAGVRQVGGGAGSHGSLHTSSERL